MLSRSPAGIHTHVCYSKRSSDGRSCSPSPASPPVLALQGWYTAGYGFGVWMGVLHALQLRVVPVHPANWKRALGLAGRGITKDDSRELAVRTFPSLLKELKRKKDHGEDSAVHLSGGRPAVRFASCCCYEHSKWCAGRFTASVVSMQRASYVVYPSFLVCAVILRICCRGSKALWGSATSPSSLLIKE